MWPLGLSGNSFLIADITQCSPRYRNHQRHVLWSEHSALTACICKFIFACKANNEQQPSVLLLKIASLDLQKEEKNCLSLNRPTRTKGGIKLILFDHIKWKIIQVTITLSCHCVWWPWRPNHTKQENRLRIKMTIKKQNKYLIKKKSHYFL